MDEAPIVRHRMACQLLARPRHARVADAVAWMGAVQAQDYAAARWALGLRLRGSSDAAIERAFDRGAILRTHVLRPTWHFVAPADIRWLQALTGPRVNARNAPTYRRLGLDAAQFRRSDAVLARALEGGRHLTRDELAQALRHARVDPGDSLRLSCLVMHAELQALICSGPRRGRQFTYARLDDRVPPARALDRGEALAELARRFFRSHGPASAHDFAKWSGLTVTDACAGLEAVQPQLASMGTGARALWFSPSRHVAPPSPTAHLLPIYDEYLVGYHDRESVLDRSHPQRSRTAADTVFANPLLIDGRVCGTWQRLPGAGDVQLRVDAFEPLSVLRRRAVAAAATRYGEFLGVPVSVVDDASGASKPRRRR